MQSLRLSFFLGSQVSQHQSWNKWTHSKTRSIATAIALLVELGWETTKLYLETFGETGTEGRQSEHEVILVRRLRNALLERLNPDLPVEAIENAVTEIVHDRSRLTPVNANRELYSSSATG